MAPSPNAVSPAHDHLSNNARLAITLYSRFLTPDKYPHSDRIVFPMSELLVYNGGGNIEYKLNWRRNHLLPHIIQLIQQVGDTLSMQQSPVDTLVQTDSSRPRMPQEQRGVLVSVSTSAVSCSA